MLETGTLTQYPCRAFYSKGGNGLSAADRERIASQSGGSGLKSGLGRAILQMDGGDPQAQIDGASQGYKPTAVAGPAQTVQASAGEVGKRRQTMKFVANKGYY